ncbi:hypothetical protein E4M02_09095 [Brevundimonas sp. S30B]|uniref:hypothetical protein n=1 Tax=unclassified Brevundimonas TaxID=2622653 RepID=UPI0010725613|nr:MULTISPECIES: hypothetical protein [unclassified Brevundimonas]QBX38507.1 hypothetical protein E4M01_12530 [Brevundimonas sp. MF30-B]TFW02215.1 hypothetical protein E4M02_09095 [Brevundimonas sp. S30B]
MFEFGRDLRKLFAQARESDDLAWLELIGVDLLETEARQQSVDAGRVSCPRPFEAELRAARLWREHARRAGSNGSLERAQRAAAYAARAAKTGDEAARAAIEAARVELLRFDLCGGLGALARALGGLNQAAEPKSGQTALSLAAARAAAAARQARLEGSAEMKRAALSALDAAVAALGSAQGMDEDALRLDRASLALELGVEARDTGLLDRAGQDLRDLVQAASPDYRPLTRARALVLCAAGMSALANLGDHVEARRQADALFEAAAKQFTPDHSPLDWAAIQVVRAESGGADLLDLARAEALTAGSGLVVGALAAIARWREEARLAEADGDLAGLATLEARLLDRLRAGPSALDWAGAQVAVAETALARQRLTGAQPHALGLILAEAALCAREQAAPLLAWRAERLLDSAVVP